MEKRWHSQASCEIGEYSEEISGAMAQQMVLSVHRALPDKFISHLL